MKEEDEEEVVSEEERDYLAEALRQVLDAVGNCSSQEELDNVFILANGMPEEGCGCMTCVMIRNNPLWPYWYINRQRTGQSAPVAVS